MDRELSQMSIIGLEVIEWKLVPQNVPHKKNQPRKELVISDLERIQTSNLLSRNQVHYSVMLRGLYIDYQ